MQTFNEINLNKDLNKALAELGFIKPTPIQAKTIPILMDSDQDMIGSAQTGTGKTAAFGLPSIHLTNLDEPGTQTLILCPTRELCMQVANDLRAYSKYIDKLGIVSIYGGASIEKQIKSIKKRSHIVVGTPGRTKDLLTRKKLFIDKVQRIVLDEADEMLNMGFKEDIDGILEHTPDEKSTWLFSATMPKEVAKISKSYMTKPIEVTVGKKNVGAENIEHIFYNVSENH